MRRREENADPRNPDAEAAGSGEPRGFLRRHGDRGGKIAGGDCFPGRNDGTIQVEKKLREKERKRMRFLTFLPKILGAILVILITTAGVSELFLLVRRERNKYPVSADFYDREKKTLIAARREQRSASHGEGTDSEGVE